MLRPEIQDMDAYVDGINNIVEAQQRVAQAYLDDGSVNDACPPLRALLHIMAKGNYEGKTIDAPEIRNMFTHEYLLQSNWYRERLKNKQVRDLALWRTNLDYVKQRLDEILESDTEERANLQAHVADAERMIKVVTSDDYTERLMGTLGADWVHRET